eukprot:g4893.t1
MKLSILPTRRRIARQGDLAWLQMSRFLLTGSLFLGSKVLECKVALRVRRAPKRWSCMGCLVHSMASLLYNSSVGCSEQYGFVIVPLSTMASCMGCLECSMASLFYHDYLYHWLLSAQYGFVLVPWLAVSLYGLLSAQYSFVLVPWLAVSHGFKLLSAPWLAAWLVYCTMASCISCGQQLNSRSQLAKGISSRLCL